MNKGDERVRVLEDILFVDGKGDGVTTACLMSARSLLDGRPFEDSHPSGVLRKIGIRINDGSWWESEAERTAILLPFALDERLCALKCDASPDVEQKRAKMCAEWALSFATPIAFDQAALALEGAKQPEYAKTLREHAAKLRAEPTLDAATALAANAAVDAANAATATVLAANAATATVLAATDATANAAYRAVDAANAAVDAATAATADAAHATAHAYANAAHAAANAANANVGAAMDVKRQIRDSLIELFDRLLDVGQ